jgi:phage baseplate assembly protein W
MAFGAKQIFPNDTKPRVAIGINLPLNGEAVFNSNYQTKNAIKNNLINYFLTNPGERLGNPSFGAGLRDFLFELITNDNLDFLEENIQEKIKIFFPNVNLKDVELISNQDKNEIKITITYSITNTGINDELELSFT